MSNHPHRRPGRHGGRDRAPSDGPPNFGLPTHTSLTPEGEIERAAMIANNARSPRDPAYEPPASPTEWPRWVSRLNKAQRWAIAVTFVVVAWIAATINDLAGKSGLVSAILIAVAVFVFTVVAPLRRRPKQERRH